MIQHHIFEVMGDLTCLVDKIETGLTEDEANQEFINIISKHIKDDTNKVECTIAICRYIDTIWYGTKGINALVVDEKLDVVEGDVGLTKYGKVEIIYIIKKCMPIDDKRFLISVLGELKFIRNKSLSYQYGMGARQRIGD